MVFSAAVIDASERDIQSIALTVQVMIDPAKRGYDEQTRERLAELFGPPTSWTPSTQALSWARIMAVVPGFVGSTTFALEVPCTYDLEVAATKYFYAVADGEVPLSFHFNGTVFYRAAIRRLQVAPVPWSASAHFQMPVAAWRAMIAEHYPGGGWIRLGERHARGAQCPPWGARPGELRRLHRRVAGGGSGCWMSSSLRCSTRATRSTPTPRVRPRTPRRRRSGSCTRLPMPPSARERSTTPRSSASRRPGPART